MKGTTFKQANRVLRAPSGQEDTVYDLPVCAFQYADGVDAVASCWQMTWRERFRAFFGGRIFFIAMGLTHPPILLTSGLPPEFKHLKENTNE